MSTLNILLVLYGFSMHCENPRLKEIEIADSSIKKVLNRYVAEHDFFSDPEINPSLLLRFDSAGEDQIVYVSSNFLLSYFESNVPDSFAKVDGKIVFIYKAESKQDSCYSFKDFHSDFKEVLHEDVDPKGQFNSDYFPKHFINPDNWRITLKDDSMTNIQRVIQFPMKSFFREFDYTEGGYMIYEDGIYAASDIPPEPPYGFSLADYLEKNTSLIVRENFEATLTFIIDETGKASDVQVDGLKDKSQEDEVIEAILKMPKWSPGRIKNKAVKVRDSYGLKEF